jgi:hypothetical protein
LYGSSKKEARRGSGWFIKNNRNKTIINIESRIGNEYRYHRFKKENKLLKNNNGKKLKNNDYKERNNRDKRDKENKWKEKDRLK